jgi:cell division protein FtsB
MNTINLLPKEEKVRDVRSIMITALLVIMIMLLILMAVFSIILYMNNSKLTPQLENYRRVNMLTENYIKKLEAYDKFKVKVNEKEKVIEYLTGKEIIWSDVLCDFTESMPENTYINYIEGNSGNFYTFISELDKLKTEEVEKIRYFNIIGYALDNTDVSKLIVMIRNMDDVGDVTINNISKDYTTESNLEVLSFNINAYIDIEPYLEKIKEETTKTEEGEVGEEGLLEEELEVLE